MNEKGFFTILGICLLLIISLLIMTVQETEKNYSYDAKNFQTELELQNAADSSIIEAAEKIRLNPNLLKKPTSTEILLGRKYYQRKISVSQPKKSERLKHISVEVYGERGTIEQYLRNYQGEENYKDEKISVEDKTGIILISAASGEEKIFGTKKFRSSIAIIFDDDENIIYFLNKAERGNLKT